MIQISQLLKYFIFFCLLPITDYCFCQVPSLPIVAQPAPNAASLFNFSEIPVSNYTGVPSILIPLFTVKSKDNELPISIAYHSGGIKVEDEASFVGLGWALQAGGVITEIKGTNPGSDLPCNPISNSTSAFIYNFCNYAGRFFLKNGKGVMVKQEDLDIQQVVINSVNGFKIKTPNGDSYLFANIETSNNSTSWYLTSITSPNNNVINFEYEQANDFDFISIDHDNQLIVDYQASAGVYGGQGDRTKWVFDDAECRGFMSGQAGPSYYPWPANEHTITKTLYLKKIYSDQAEANFNYEDRDDLDKPGTVMPKRLQSLTIKDVNTLTVAKKYSFDYDYSDFNNLNTVQSKRLRLLSIKEWSSGGEYQYINKFTYNSIQLPLKTSKNQDHWGYYNGPVNNSSLHPIQGANREPNENYSKAGMIESIIYPTGGKTVFEFESNDYSNKGSTGFKKGGGVRVKRVLIYDGVNTAPKIRRYEYINDANGQLVSSGKLIYALSYSVFRSFTAEHNCYGYYLTYNLECNCYKQVNFIAMGQVQGGYYMHFAHPSQLTNLDFGSPVSYDKVTVYDEGANLIGKTTYEYVNQEANNWGPAQVTGDNLQLAMPGNGTLKKEAIYGYDNLSNSYSPLKIQENEYEVVNAQTLGFYLEHYNAKYLPPTLGAPDCTKSNFSAVSFVTNYYRLKKSTVSEFFPANNTSTPLITTHEYTYNYTDNPKTSLIATVKTQNSKK